MAETPWRCCGCGAAARGEVKPCSCATQVGARGKEYIVFTTPTAARRKALSDQIKTRILGIPRDAKDIFLEDEDWAEIVTALEGR